jgi:hypothetical protein
MRELWSSVARREIVKSDKTDQQCNPVASVLHSCFAVGIELSWVMSRCSVSCSM